MPGITFASAFIVRQDCIVNLSSWESRVCAFRRAMSCFSVYANFVGGREKERDLRVLFCNDCECFRRVGHDAYVIYMLSTAYACAKCT